MYAITFDMSIKDLRENYGDPYNNAYFEIKEILLKEGFEWTQGSVYLYSGSENNLAKVYSAISKLSQVDWFKRSVRDIRVFRVEDWSDFTEIVRG